MSIRTIQYTVSANGITPQSVSPAGSQNDHNPTNVKFNIDNTFLTSLRTEATTRSGNLYYRFDIYDGEGSVHRTDSALVAADATFEEILLTEPITRYGGKIIIFLVFTIIKTATQKTDFEIYTGPAKLLLSDLPDSTIAGDNTERESFTTLAEAAKEAADRAETAAESAEDDAEIAETQRILTQEARYALEHGAQFIFVGGDAQSQRTVDIVVDSALSAVSTNPIANKAVYNALLTKATQSDITTALTNLLTSQSFINASFLSSHPVGSIFPTMSSENPGLTYGGTFEQVGQGRIIAGVGTGTDTNNVTKTLVAGNNNGEYEHTLTVNEMASHSHRQANSNYVYPPEGTTGTHSIASQGTINCILNTYANLNTHNTGGGQAHNNTPPTFAIYLWKRLS